MALAVLGAATAALVVLLGVLTWLARAEATLLSTGTAPVQDVVPRPGVEPWNQPRSDGLPRVLDRGATDTSITEGPPRRTLVTGEAALLARFLCRCLREDTRGTVLDATLSLRVYGPAPGTGVFAELTERRLSRACDTDGRIEYEFMPAPSEWYVFIVGADPLCRRYEVRRSVQPGTIIDVGDVLLARGWWVAGRVLSGYTPRGETTRVRVDLPGLAVTAASEDPGPLVEDVAEDGAFHIGPLPAGRHEIRLQSRAWRLEGRCVLEVRPDAPPPFVELMVTRRRRIVGRTVDAGGVPLAGVRVGVLADADGLAQHNRPRPASTNTDEQGNFALYCPDGGAPGPYILGALAVGRPEGRATHAVDWGAEVTIVVPDAGFVEARVLDAGTQRPVRGAKLTLIREGLDAAWTAPATGAVQTDAQGGARVGGVGAGPHQLLVEAAGYGLVRTAPFRGVPGASHSLTVRLEATTAIDVEVHDESGTAMAGCVVEALGGEQEQSMTRPLPDAAFLVKDPSYRGAWVIGRSTTDERGGASIPDVPAGRIWLRCPGIGGAAALHGPFSIATGTRTRLRIVVSRGTTLRGRVDPAAACQAIAGVLLDSSDGKWRLPSANEATVVPDDAGLFVFHHVPRGVWQVVALRLIEDQGVWGKGPRRAEADFVPLATTTTEGAGVSIEVDARRLVPAQVKGRILLDGAPSPAMRVFAVEDHDRPSASWIEGQCDDSGGFVVRVPPSGRAFLAWQVSAKEGTLRGTSLDRLSLDPGQSMEVLHSVTKARLTLLVKTSTGAIAVGVPIRLVPRRIRATDEPLLVTDGRGLLELWVLAPGEWLGLAPDGRELFSVRSVDIDRHGRSTVVLQ